MNKLLDRLSQLIGDRPGLLPLVGVGLVLLNLVLQIFPGPGSGWFIDSNLLLHLGLVVGLVGMLLIRPLS